MPRLLDPTTGLSAMFMEPIARAGDEPRMEPLDALLPRSP
jgi:hypothetical protein